MVLQRFFVILSAFLVAASLFGCKDANVSEETASDAEETAAYAVEDGVMTEVYGFSGLTFGMSVSEAADAVGELTPADPNDHDIERDYLTGMEILGYPAEVTLTFWESDGGSFLIEANAVFTGLDEKANQDLYQEKIPALLDTMPKQQWLFDMDN